MKFILLSFYMNGDIFNTNDIITKGWKHVAITDKITDTLLIKSACIIGHTVFVWGEILVKTEYDEPVVVEIHCPITDKKVKLYENQQIEGHEAWCMEEYFNITDNFYLIQDLV